MIFRKQQFLGWPFWILFFFSLLLMVIDQKKMISPRIKTYLQLAMTPLDYAVILPSRSYDFIRDYFTLQHDLLHDKKNWQGQQLIFQAKLQEMDTLKQQNQELKSLLKTAVVEQDQKYLLAKVIAINAEGHEKEILLNRGSRSAIQIGQGVVAADGVVGQIIQVTPLTSRVILLSDARSAIPVFNQRTQENLIVIGKNNNEELMLLNVSTTSDLKVGDLLFSSGLGGHYPEHYPVGSISAIKMNGKNIAQVLIKPSANLKRLHLVLVVFVKEEDDA